MSVLSSIFRGLSRLRRRPRESSASTGTGRPERETLTLGPDLERNLALLQEYMQPNDDLISRRITIPGAEEIEAAVLYIEGMIEGASLDMHVLRPLLHTPSHEHRAELTRKNVVHRSREALFTAGNVKEVKHLEDVVLSLLSGECVVLFQGAAQGLVMGLKGIEHRSVEQPQAQSIIRGPRDGFTESLRVNTVLIRRRIRDPNLSLEWIKVGRRTHTDVVIAYIRDVTNPEIVDQVKQRLDAIDIDGILESGYIEQMIEDNWWTVFPTVQETERPDQVAGGLLDGRVAILVDNTPFALLVPATVPMFLSSPEDMYFRWPIATLVRLLRYGAAFASLAIPSLYVALTSFHPEMLPTNLALSIGAAREGVSFPALFEALLMEAIMEVLREAGIRLPGQIGQTIGIVGAIIIGEAAVSAGLVSPIMIVAVAITAISSFVIPTYSFAISFRILRFALLIFAGVAGLFGVAIGLLIIVGHLSILKSFGVPYMAPLSPVVNIGDWKDTWLIYPRIAMHKRPSFLEPIDDDRLDDRRDDDPVKGRERL